MAAVAARKPRPKTPRATWPR